MYSTLTYGCVLQNQVPVQLQQAQEENTLEPGIWLYILVHFQLEDAHGMQVDMKMLPHFHIQGLWNSATTNSTL